MKEINLTLTKENEFSFEKPEPYITINIANKETYEKLVDIINRDTPAEVEVEKIVDMNVESCKIKCPECKELIAFARTENTARRLTAKYCSHCGQALVCEV